VGRGLRVEDREEAERIILILYLGEARISNPVRDVLSLATTLDGRDERHF
jgi:hypothetical protein